MKLETSVVEYPDRGKWGNSRFRGNTTGHIVKDLIDTFQPESVLDPMAGSGTTGDVCEEYPDIDYFGFDLSFGDNILDPQTQSKMAKAVPRGVDLVFWHPPYWEMVRYHPNDARDFAYGPYEVFLQRMQNSLVFLGRLLTGRANSRIAILMGDYRKAGRYYWIPRDISTPDKLKAARLDLDSIVMKVQHNVTSNTTNYSKPIIRIQHETLLILRPKNA